GDLHAGASSRPDEDGEVVGDALARLEGSRFDDAHLAGKMALGANTIAAVGIELRGVYNFTRRADTSRFHLGDMRFPRAVAALATYTGLKKRRRSKSVLRTRKRLQSAGVALQAGGLHRTGKGE